MPSMRVVCVPLSERNAIPRLWTGDTLYVNCYDSDNTIGNGTCIYDILKDPDRRLCPLQSTDKTGSGFRCPVCKTLCVNA